MIALAATGLGCSPPQSEIGWRSDWNARVDANERRRDHPCGDFAFDPWAKSFLDGCTTSGSGGDCAARWKWVDARSKQCRVWKNWLLRNHHRSERRDELPEPPTKVR